jgi:hypothetical protein
VFILGNELEAVKAADRLSRHNLTLSYVIWMIYFILHDFDGLVNFVSLGFNQFRVLSCENSKMALSTDPVPHIILCSRLPCIREIQYNYLLSTVHAV